MNWKSEHWASFVGIAILGSALGACGKGGPADSDVVAAVTDVAKASEGYSPFTGTTSGPCGVMHGPITEVTKVEVVERGEQKDGHASVKVNVSGTCMAQFPRCGSNKNQLCPPEPTKFTTEKPMAFRLKQDDFGKWKAARP